MRVALARDIARGGVRRLCSTTPGPGYGLGSGRDLSGYQPNPESSSDPQDLYNHAKRVALENSRVKRVSSHTVFSNNDISLRDISVWGFDYDYTLATYNDQLNRLIYDLALKVLVSSKGYPNGLLKCEYQPDSACRGLHYDTARGMLMKIDAYHKIQPGTVYRGRHRVSDDEVRELFPGLHVGIDVMNAFHGGVGSSGGKTRIHQFTDLFALSTIGLLRDVTDYFLDNEVPFAAEYVFQDVKGAVDSIHASGQIHRMVADDLPKYLDTSRTDRDLLPLLKRLVDKGKKLFVITNSPYTFVERGMCHIIGKDWKDLFDVIVVDSKKPRFFADVYRPFRKINSSGSLEWSGVERLEKGSVYQQGNLQTFTQLTGWRGDSVLYFGDHVYGDLADPSLRTGWRTAAIIREVGQETHTANREEYRRAVAWRVSLEALIETLQHPNDQRIAQARALWKQERDQLKHEIKCYHHHQFGSLFRCHTNPSYFSRRLSRFADLYTSDLCNFLLYPADHTFYPKRFTLPHERFFMRKPVFQWNDCLP